VSRRMRLMFLSHDYPHASYPYLGSFNERSACFLKEACDALEVLSPRPYAPPLLSSMVPRWGAYRTIPSSEIRKGVRISRPPYLIVSKIASSFWSDRGAYWGSRETAREMHRRQRFDAILSFDLKASGGVAWRIGRDLGIPACGWAIGGDVRAPAESPYGRVLKRTLKELDLVFYQSGELLREVRRKFGAAIEGTRGVKHVVLPRGIPEAPDLPRAEVRRRIRAELQIDDGQILVLYIGRVLRQKGMLELLEAIARAAPRDPRIVCVAVGSNPAFDETAAFRQKMALRPEVQGRLRIVSGCAPEKIWEYLCASDIFAFPSHAEGMPNSLLEAMIMEVPCVCFAIPAVAEVEGGTGGLLAVAALDAELFSDAILRLAASPEERRRIGVLGRQRVESHFLMKVTMPQALEYIAGIVRQREAAVGGELAS
jgi:teichuronic acid biosynthesis glycosyltransferase TuaC